MAGDGFGALVKVGQADSAQMATIRWWQGRGAGLRELIRITGLSAVTVQNALTDLARELAPIAPETRDALQLRLQDQLDRQRTSLQGIIDGETTRTPDRIAAHRALLLLARTHADIAGLHRTQDTELARSIEGLLTTDGARRVAVAIEYAQADDRKDQNEGARLHRSEAAATRKHYTPAPPDDD